MVPSEYVVSLHFGTKIRVHGYLAHDYAPEGKIRWFIYQIVDEPCNLIYVGSTVSLTNRWSQHKSKANSEASNSTGLSKHFMNGGCPNDQGRDKRTLFINLVDHLDTTREELNNAGHEPGAKCKCCVCGKLKTLEDKFMVRTGSFYNHGLNTRDEIRRKSRCNW